MAGRVIQGYFIGGAMRPQPAPRAAAGAAPSRHSTGAPPPAFAGRAAPLQARMAPGRPPLAHQGAGHVAQPHGGNGSFEIDPVRLGLARGGGKPLARAVLAKMEAAFGADFSAVRVHVGPQASRIGAIAFTTGNDLYFAPGRYQPDSIQGQQLIGHELAHVIQQRQGRVRAATTGTSIVQDRALEAEADRLGMRAAALRSPSIPDMPCAVQRQASRFVQRAAAASSSPSPPDAQTLVAKYGLVPYAGPGGKKGYVSLDYEGFKDDQTEAEEAVRWYRAMTLSEFIVLDQTSQVSMSHFGGISPSAPYSLSYLKGDCKCLVQFETKEAGYLWNLMVRKYGVSPKGEQGIMSIGLGPTGTKLWAKPDKEMNKFKKTVEVASTSALFNSEMKIGAINFRLLALLA